MGKLTKKLIFGLMIYCCINSSYAVDLLTAYHDALHNDPIYQQAVATYLETKEVKARAVAALLPQLDANASISRERQTILPTGNKTFDVQTYSLSLDQQIFNANAFQQLGSANFTVRQAEATLSAAAQNLIIRVSQAYFNVLEAHDILQYTRAQQKSVYKALQAVKTRYKVNHATITEIDQAQASYDSISARYYGNKINLHNRIEQLSNITGKSYKTFKNLKEPFSLIYPQPANEHAWVMSAEQNNLVLIAARFGINAAHKRIKAQYGNFLPDVALVGQYNQSNDPILSGTNPNVTSKSIGINVNLPILTGGLRHSQVREAKAVLKNAMATMDQAYLSATADASQAYYGVVIGIKQVKKGRQAVKSSHSSLAHTQEGYLAGTQTILDVLQEERVLFAAQTTYSRDRFNFLLNTLLLKQAAGTLSPVDLVKINRSLH